MMKTTSDMELRDFPVGQLGTYHLNPRRGNIEAIARSLETNGQYRPIVVNLGNHTGRPLEVLAGNHTLLAARHLGWDTVKGTTVDVDQEGAARIVAADNRLADLGGYDQADLAELLAGIDDLDGTGYTPADLQALLEAAGDPPQPADPDDVPEPPIAPVSRTGDVWLLGRHRLVVGDGLDPDVLEQACDGKPAQLYLTDPPYNVDYIGKTADALTINNDAMTDPQFQAFLTDLFKAALANIQPGGPAYVFYSSSQSIPFHTAFREAGWEDKQQLIWVKNTMVLSRQDYHWQHEPIIYGWRPGAAHRWTGDRDKVTVHEDPPADPKNGPRCECGKTTIIRADKPAANRHHPTMKPVALLEQLISNSSQLGNLILDSCAGSGSTLIAAHNLGRRAALVELDPVYADVICRRWQDYTGQMATLEATGEAHSFTV